MSRDKHEFQFAAGAVADAAKGEATYHRAREVHWRGLYAEAVAQVKGTASIKVSEIDVTGGKQAHVTVEYGDPAAYRLMGLAFEKMQSHRRDAERYETDYRVYATQGDRTYELSGDDVHYFRLGGEQRPK